MINLMDLIRNNKLRRIFNPSDDSIIMDDPRKGGITGNQTYGGPYNTRPMDEISRPNMPNDDGMPEVQHNAQNQFESLLSQFPQRQPVSKMRKFGSIIAGMGSNDPIGTVDKFQNYHYYNQLKDYVTKLPFFQQAADNERSFNDSVMRSWLADRKLAETERVNTEKLKDADEKMKISQQNADTQASRAKTYAAIARGGQLVQDENGLTNIVFKDGSFLPVDVDQFSAKELEELRHKNRASEIDQRGNVQSGLIKDRAEATKDVYKDRIETNIASGVKAGSITGISKPETEANKIARQNRIARELASDPKWAPYIEMDKSNRFIKINPNGPAQQGGIFNYFNTSPIRKLTPAEVKELGDKIFERSGSKEEKKDNDPLGIRR